MRITISGQGIDAMETMRDYVTQRLRFVLSRFGGEITRVRVHLVKNRTERGETHLACRLTISLVSGRKIFADVSHTDVYAGIDQAVDRVRRSVRLSLDTTRAGVTSGMAGAWSRVGGAPFRRQLRLPQGRGKKG